MVKSATPGMTSHLAGEVTTLAVCWQITRTDGTVYRYTEHDEDVVYAGDTYKAAFGFRRTNFTTKSDLSVANLDVVGVLDDDEIDENDLRGGLFDSAEIRTFLVNYEDPDGDGILRLMAGYVGEVTIRDGRFTFEMRSLEDRLAQVIGENYTPTCRADLGDSRCTFDVAANTQAGAVTAVTDRSTVTVQAITTDGGLLEQLPGGAGSDAPADWFNGGLVTFTSGLNDGLSREVKDYTAGGQVTFFLPFPFDMAVGDEFEIYRGCPKTVEACRDVFSNIENFRGEPYVPGNDQIFAYPDAQS